MIRNSFLKYLFLCFIAVLFVYVLPSSGLAMTGDGTSNNPYQITCSDDLLAFARKINEELEIYACAKLMNDINMPSGTKWISIGNQTYRYNGTFNGNNKTISNLAIDASSSNNQGLFAYIGTSGSVNKLRLSNCSVSGQKNVGSIAGYNYGIISNCVFSGLISGSENVGGITGNNNGTISSCGCSGSVSASKCVGGIAGYSNGSGSSNCWNTGTVIAGKECAGGIIGYNIKGNVKNCCNTGTVTAPTICSGIVGKIENSQTDNCSNLKIISSDHGQISVLQISIPSSGDPYPQIVISVDPETNYALAGLDTDPMLTIVQIEGTTDM